MAAASTDHVAGVAWSRALVALATLAVLVVASLASLRPPSPVSANAPPTDFSSERAMKHLEIIAARPHRMGSPEHDAVRAYIVHELSALGLAPEVQETSVAQLRFTERWGWPARVATVKNVVARLRGTESGQAVLLMAHYDSRSMTPGAGDDGAGVAAMLETARALAVGERPRRDVIFLVTDGEELGLLGAKAFLDEHPAAHDAALVLNFDARGNRGPAMMFQTSDHAAHLVRELARAAPHVVASSLSQAIYKRMPNDSDLSEFLPTGVDAMNVAYIGGLERYHAPADTVVNMEPETLQHVGSYMLPLARHFASMQLPLARDGDATYFNLGPFFVRYPARADVGIAVGVDALLAGVIAVAVKRRGARIGHVLASVGVTLGAMLGAALAAHGVWSFASSHHAEYEIIAATNAALVNRWGVALVLIALAVTLGLYSVVAPRLRPLELGLGAAIVFGVLAVPAAIALPGGGWLIAWPLAGALVPWTIAIRVASAEEYATSNAALVARLVACVVPIALLAPVIAMFFAAFGPTAALVIAPLVALSSALLAPAIGDVLGADRRAAPLAAIAGAAAFVVFAWATPAFDRATPRPDTLFFAVDLDAHRSWWASPDPAPDAWTAKVLTAPKRGALPAQFSAYGTSDLTSTEVPFADLDGPTAQVQRDDRAQTRSLDLRILVPRSAELIVVRAPTNIAAARAQGHELPTQQGGLLFYYSAPPASGFALSLQVTAATPVKLWLTTQRAGFPRLLSDALGPRPEGLAAKPGMLPPWDEMQESDMTVVTRELSL